MNLTYTEFLKLMRDDAVVKGKPVHGTFSLTPRCNLQCRMCYVCNPSVADEELSGDQWLDIMRQARDEGMLFSLITGGEPLLHKDFWQIYTGLRRLGIYVTVNSNGTTITPEVADKFKKAPPVQISISVYGSSPEAYEKVTGSAAGYEKVIRGIELLRERRVKFKLRTILTKDTAPDIENIVKLILSYGKRVGLGNYISLPVCENDNDPKSLRLSGWEIAEYTKTIEKIVKEYYDTHGDPRARITEEMQAAKKRAGRKAERSAARRTPRTR